MKTPVIFLVFNRPEHTARVFQRIRAARPSKLFVVADGPRKSKPMDEQTCMTVRRLVEAGVDWDCELTKIFSETNLGCGKRVSSGITAAFETVEKAIVLEDDCLPDPTFFRFCEEMLERYEPHTNIGHVGGCNFLKKHNPHRYYFSRYGHVWGWATWKRAWSLYDFSMSDWPLYRDSRLLENGFQNSGASRYWSDLFDKTTAGEVDTWDYQWIFSLWKNNLSCIVPGTNLVQNIGFDETGAHSVAADSHLSMASSPSQFPLVHPHRIEKNEENDREVERLLYSGGPSRRLKAKFKRALKRLSGRVESNCKET